MEYILLELTESSSRLNVGQTYWRLTFYSIDDGTFWEMTVDPTFRNFRKSGWNHVVRDPSPWGVYTDLQRTRRISTSGIPIVSADTPARLQYRCQDNQEALLLMEADYNLRHPSGSTRFGELFDVT
jgi:hypothetical protein